VAAELKKATGADAELVVGDPGEFTVWAGETKIAEKSGGRFPEPADVIAAFRATPAP